MIKLENIGSLVTYNSNLGIMDTLNDVEIIIDNDLILEIGNNLRKIEERHYSSLYSKVQLVLLC